MKKKTIIIGIAVIVVALIIIRLAANYSKIQEKKTSKDITAKAVSVTTVIAEKKSLSRQLSVVATTAGVHEVQLQAEMAAQITELHFKLGDYVKKGQLLVQLNDRTQALALENAKLNLSRLEDDYGRVKSLYAGKAGTETQLRDSRIAYENAKIAVDQAKRQLELTRIVAPFDGYIYAKSVEKGGFVGVGTAMLSIADISQLKAAMNVAENDVYKLKNGQKLEITAQVYPGVTFSGTVSFISEKADKWHNYSVEALIDNQKAHPLRSGTFVNASFNFGSSEPVLVIPRKALQGSLKDASVFVVEGNTARFRKITIGQDYGEYLEVLSGLKENEEIVVSGQMSLVDGSSITK